MFKNVLGCVESSIVVSDTELALMRALVVAFNEIALSKLGYCLNFYIKRKTYVVQYIKKYMTSIQRIVC